MLKVHIVPKWGSSMSVPWPVVVAQVADDLTRFEGACPETTQAAHRQGDVGNDPRRQEPDDVGEGQGSVEETEEGRAANSGADGDVDRSAGGPYSTMVYVAASLGLRVEEVVALQWGRLRLSIEDGYHFAAHSPTLNSGSPSQIHHR